MYLPHTISPYFGDIITTLHIKYPTEYPIHLLFGFNTFFLFQTFYKVMKEVHIEPVQRWTHKNRSNQTNNNTNGAVNQNQRDDYNTSKL